MSGVNQTGEVFSKSSLDDALLEQKSVIVIKDSKLGHRTILWISLGRCLDRMTIITALGSAVCSADVHKSISVFGKPLALCSLLTHVAYNVLWSSNPLMQYRIAQGPSIYTIIRGHHHPSAILVKNEECKRNYLYTVVSVAAVVMAFWSDVTTHNFKESFEKLKDLFKKEK